MFEICRRKRRNNRIKSNDFVDTLKGINYNNVSKNNYLPPATTSTIEIKYKSNIPPLDLNMHNLLGNMPGVIISISPGRCTFPPTNTPRTPNTPGASSYSPQNSGIIFPIIISGQLSTRSYNSVTVTLSTTSRSDYDQFN